MCVFVQVCVCVFVQVCVCVFVQVCVFPCFFGLKREITSMRAETWALLVK